MDRVVKGIVMEIAKDSAILMTSDGEFLKVKKPSHSITLGDEITSTVFTARRINHMLRYTGIAAAILLLLIPFTYFRVAYATVAYVNVDINPSLELGINRYNKVNDVVGLNSDGDSLLKDTSLKGMDIKDALDRIITKAKDEGYIDDDEENNIEVALVKLNPGNTNINEENIMGYVKDAVVKTDVDATIEVHSADKKVHDSAKQENISTNKYIDKTQGNENGIKDNVKKPKGPVNTDNGNNGNNNNVNNNNSNGNSNNGQDKNNPSNKSDDKNKKDNNVNKQDSDSGHGNSQNDKQNSQQGNKGEQKGKK